MDFDLRRKEEWPSSNLVNEKGAGYGNDEGQHLVPSIQAQLFGRSGNASTIVDDGGVVTNQRIARPLRDETQREDNSKPVTIAFRSKEVQVRRSLFDQKLESDGFLDLGIFELHSRIVLVSVSMVISKHAQRFFASVLRHQPSWRSVH